MQHDHCSMESGPWQTKRIKACIGEAIAVPTLVETLSHGTACLGTRLCHRARGDRSGPEIYCTQISDRFGGIRHAPSSSLQKKSLQLGVS